MPKHEAHAKLAEYIEDFTGRVVKQGNSIATFAELWKAFCAVKSGTWSKKTREDLRYLFAKRRNELAQRGHNKQGRHNLRQVGLSYVLDGENGLSLCHHVYPGNVADAEEFPVALRRIVSLLDRHGIPRDTVTLVLNRGSAALANTLELEQAGVGWISALPWNQAPEGLRERPSEDLSALSSAQPGVRAAAERALVHGKEYPCVVKYSAPFASEQLHSLLAAGARAD